jgi:hypothetical protein
MLQRALEAGVPAGWVTADEADGGSPALRGWLEARQLLYVLAVKATEPLPPASGPAMPAARLAGASHRTAGCASAPATGAKGRRWYAWSRLPLDGTGAPDGWERRLLRRSLTSGDLAYYVGAGPAGLPLIGLVRVAGGALAGRGGACRPARGCAAWTSTRSPLALLVPLDHPGPAGVRLPGGGRGHRARPASGSTRADRSDLQRGLAPLRGHGLPACRRPRAPVALVVVATPAASPRFGGSRLGQAGWIRPRRRARRESCRNFRLLPYSCSKPYAPALAKVVPGSQRTVMVRASWPCSVVPHVGSAQVNTNAEAKASPG